MSSSGRGQWLRLSGRWILFAFIVAVLLVALPPGTVGRPVSPGPPSAIAHAPSAAPATAAPASPTIARPQLNVTGGFYASKTVDSTNNKTNLACWPAYTYYCLEQSVDPSILRLANGKVGIAYQKLTTYNSTYNATSCPWDNTASRIAWRTSNNGGVSFGGESFIPLMNNSTFPAGTTSCPYASQIEPSFAESSNGSLFGAFVVSNDTPSTLLGYFSAPIYYYTTRVHDALAFTMSDDNGTTWENSSVVVGGGNISRPQIGVYGNSIYIVYENITNGTSTIPSGFYTNYPTSVWFVASTDGGSTWSTPQILPGMNSSQYWTSYSPSIAVNPSGEIAVTYSTNRSCVEYCGYTYKNYGEDIVTVLSTNNGSTWLGPYTVAPMQVESSYYYGYSYYRNFFMTQVWEYAPYAVTAWNPSNGDLYVAWEAGSNLSLGSSYAYEDYDNAAIYAGVSTNGGSVWSAPVQVSGPLAASTTVFYQGYYNPALAYLNGTIYVSYSHYIYGSAGSSLCVAGGAAGYVYQFQQYISSSTTGASWAPGQQLYLKTGTYGFYADQGWHGSIILTNASKPLPAFAALGNYFTYDPNTAKYIATQETIQTARGYSGATVNVTVLANGLPNGTQWEFTFGGQLFNNLTATNVTITNVPYGVTESFSGPTSGVQLGYRTILFGESSTSQIAFFANGTVYVNFTSYYGVEFNIEPANGFTFFEIEFGNYTVNPSWFLYSYWENYAYYNGVQIVFEHFTGGSCNFPYYFQAGYRLHLTTVYTYPDVAYIFSYQPVQYWNGTGNGSYTGLGSDANITVNAPLNQTIWVLSADTYGETFNALGLPSTSNYSFSFGGSTYTSPAGSPVVVQNVSTGPHWLANLTATSTQSGWEYFGHSSVGNPVVVPDDPVVNFSYAYVDVAAPAGTISFHAVNLTAGSVWQFELNGTVYSSSSPWINVTSHPGSFEASAFAATSANGSVGYTPNNLVSPMNVTTGQTYDITFTQAYKLTVVTGAGGRVNPTGTSFWLAQGQTTTLTETNYTGYSWGGWSGTGNGSYSGMNQTINVTSQGPIVETANFYPQPAARFSLTIVEAGVPNGTWWTVYLDGIGYSSNESMLVVPGVYSCAISGGLGQYTVLYPFAYDNASQTRYVPAPYAPVVCGGTTTLVNFQAEYYLTLGSTGSGSVSAAVGSTLIFSSGWVPAQAPVGLTATASNGYLFLGWNGTGSGSYNGTQSSVTIVPYGPVSELAVFGPPPAPYIPKYTVSFHSTTAFETGTAWSLTLGGASYSSSTPWINVTGLDPKVYSLSVATLVSPSGTTQYSPAGAPTSLSVSANLTGPSAQAIGFKVSYWVSISSSGPGSVGPTSGWLAAGARVALTATPFGNAVFVGWQATGSSGYTGPISDGNFTVTGPVSEVGTFVVPAATQTQGTSFWQSSTLWIALAVAGLVVGLLVGLVAGRMRKSQPPAMPEAEVPAEAPTAPEGEADGNPGDVSMGGGQ